MKWQFNGWACFDDFGPDQGVPDFIAKVSEIPLVTALRPDNAETLVLEGGAFDVNGEGSILVTEQCLLSDVQVRNPGLTRAGYEEAFGRYLGATNTIWLSSGCEGDDTHGHIDDVARFVAPHRIVVASAHERDREQYESSQENIARLRAAKDSQGRSFEVIELPYPSPLYCDGERLAASYLNFYISNSLVLVPSFNDENDRIALGILSDLMPNRRVVGINCVDWVIGGGSIHCSTQQEFR
jgi:agmatine deiminase